MAWSAVSSNSRSATAALHRHVSKAQELAIYAHSLAYGFGRGYLVAAMISVLAVIIAFAMIRVTKEDMAGIDPMAAPV